jgi:hypothetical protein
MATAKKEEKKAIKTALVAGTHNKPKAIYLETFDIYGSDTAAVHQQEENDKEKIYTL